MTRGKGKSPIDLALPAPWVAKADMPAIADRTAVQMKKGGATAEEIRIVWGIIRAHVVISDQYFKGLTSPRFQ